jgi:hypothetical protein
MRCCLKVVQGVFGEVDPLQKPVQNWALHMHSLIWRLLCVLIDFACHVQNRVFGNVLTWVRSLRLALIWSMRDEVKMRASLRNRVWYCQPRPSLSDVAMLCSKMRRCVRWEAGVDLLLRAVRNLAVGERSCLGCGSRPSVLRGRCRSSKWSTAC